MTDLIIRYKDGEGEVTERRISNFAPLEQDPKEAILAFCHLSKVQRPFRISSILSAAYAETGEVVENVYKLFGASLEEDGRERLSSLTASISPAIKVLKCFSMEIRGTAMAKRERTHIVRFIQENADVRNYGEIEIDDWLRKLQCREAYKYLEGETSEYIDLLKRVPRSLIGKCRRFAIAIAKGSGRKPIPPETIQRINEEFTT